MSQVEINQIVEEEKQQLEQEINNRVVARLQNGRQEAVNRLQEAQADIAAIDAEIAARSPQPAVEEPTPAPSEEVVSGEGVVEITEENQVG